MQINMGSCKPIGLHLLVCLLKSMASKKPFGFYETIDSMGFQDRAFLLTKVSIQASHGSQSCMSVFHMLPRRYSPREITLGEKNLAPCRKVTSPMLHAPWRVLLCFCLLLLSFSKHRGAHCHYLPNSVTWQAKNPWSCRKSRHHGHSASMDTQLWLPQGAYTGTLLLTALFWILLVCPCPHQFIQYCMIKKAST